MVMWDVEIGLTDQLKTGEKEVDPQKIQEEIPQKICCKQTQHTKVAIASLSFATLFQPVPSFLRLWMEEMQIV